MSTALEAIEALPQLPLHGQLSYVIDSTMRSTVVRSFTATQMQDYARAAVVAAFAAAQKDLKKNESLLFEKRFYEECGPGASNYIRTDYQIGWSWAIDAITARQA